MKMFRSASVEETARATLEGIEKIETAIDQILSKNGQDSKGLIDGIEKLWAWKESEFWQRSDMQPVSSRYLSFALITILEKSKMIRPMLEYGGEYVPYQFTPFGQAVLMHMYQKHIVEPARSQVLSARLHSPVPVPSAKAS